MKVTLQHFFLSLLEPSAKLAKNTHCWFSDFPWASPEKWEHVTPGSHQEQSYSGGMYSGMRKPWVMRENTAGYFSYLLQQSKFSQNLVAKSQNTKPWPLGQTQLDTCFWKYVLLSEGHIHLFTYHPWLLYSQSWEPATKMEWPQRSKILTIQLFTESLLTSSLARGFVNLTIPWFGSAAISAEISLKGLIRVFLCGGGSLLRGQTLMHKAYQVASHSMSIAVPLAKASLRLAMEGHCTGH